MNNKTMTIAIKGGKPTLDQRISYGKQYIDAKDILAVNEVLKSAFLTAGPKVKEFEEKLCELTKAKYAVVLSSGTAALHTACYAAGITVGDEVIVTAITFVASANCILYLGGTPIFADINPYTWNIDPKEVEKKITSKTKAIIAVDFTGQAVQLDELKRICKKHNLLLIEDASHSIGTKYKDIPVGGIADLTTFSFHPVKTITCGEGGAILTNNEEFFRKMEMFRTHGITRDSKLMTQIPYMGYQEQIELGFNYRMTDFQAALGISQLEKLGMFSKRRNEIVRLYNDAFFKIPQLTIQKEIPESETTRHLYIVRINTNCLTVGRDKILSALNAENVGVQVHYSPVYYSPYYQSLGYKRGLCPKAEELCEEIISIPLYYSLTNEDVESVIKAVIKVINYYRK